MGHSRYRAICFDLDGTLLPMELSDFMDAYIKSLYIALSKWGLSPDTFQRSMKAGIGAMALHEDGRLNCEAFWDAFFQEIDESVCDWRDETDRYYEESFGKLGEMMQADSSALRAVTTLSEKGYPLVLATMPMFPLRAVEWRLSWANLDAGAFSRITHFANSTSIKPKLAYYAEVLAALGVEGKDVLMVGNNTVEDLAFRGLGADAYLVTDHLIDPCTFDISQVKNGSLADFADWAESLPVCDNPAVDISTGVVSVDETERCLQENKLVEEENPLNYFIMNGLEA